MSPFVCPAQLCNALLAVRMVQLTPNGMRFSGEPSERSERPSKARRRFRWKRRVGRAGFWLLEQVAARLRHSLPARFRGEATDRVGVALK